VTVTAKEFTRIDRPFVFEPSTFVFKKLPEEETVRVETDEEVVVNKTERRKSFCC